MRHALFCFLLWTITTLQLHAQVPGYLGKRLLISADIGSSMTFLGLTPGNRGVVNRYGGAEANLGIQNRLGINLEYITSRKGSLRLNYGLMKAGMVLTAQTFFYGYTLLETEHDLFLHNDYQFFRLGYRSYNKKEIGFAPMGLFFNVHAEYVLAGSRIVDKSTPSFINGAIAHGPLGIDMSNQGFIFTGIEVGKSFPINNSFLISFSTELNLMLNNSYQYIDITTNQGSYNQNLRASILINNIFFSRFAILYAL